MTIRRGFARIKCAECKHPREVHLHYRFGNDCGMRACGCRQFRWWRKSR